MEQGFNGSLVSVGVRGSGKTLSLFETILSQLYHPQKGEGHRTIAVSAWVLQDQRIADLLASSESTSKGTHNPLDYTCIHCPDLATALEVLNEARRRAPGALAHDPNIRLSEKDRCHFFLRIILHTADSASNLGGETDNIFGDSGSLSTLLIADLLGTANTDDDRSFHLMNEEEKVQVRANNQQLSSLFKVMHEMATTSRTAATGHHSRGAAQASGSQPPLMRLTSARDSKLSVILAPVLQGNAHCSVVVFLRDGEAHASEARKTLSATSGVTDIASACYRVKDVTLRSLNLSNCDSVLSLPRNNVPKGRESSSLRPHNTASKDESHPVSVRAAHDTSSSADFEDMNLSAVLAGDFHRGESSSSRSQLESNSVDIVLTSERHPVAPPSAASVRSHEEVSRTMDAFHDLMQSLQHEQHSDSLTTHTNDKTPTAHISQRQHVFTQDREWSIHEVDSHSYSPPPPPPVSSGLASDTRHRSRHSPSSPSQRRRASDSGRQGGGLLSDEGDQGSHQNRHIGFDGHNASAISTETADITTALRELQRTASAQDRALIEAEIKRLMGEIDMGPVIQPTAVKSVHVNNGFESSYGTQSKPHRYSNHYSSNSSGQLIDDEEDDDSYLMTHRPSQTIKSRESRPLAVSWGDEDDALEGEGAEELDDSLECATHKQGPHLTDSREGKSRRLERFDTDDATRHTGPYRNEPAAREASTEEETRRSVSPSVYQSIDSSSPFVSYSDIFQEKLRAMGEAAQQHSDEYFTSPPDFKRPQDGWYQSHTAQVMSELERPPVAIPSSSQTNEPSGKSSDRDYDRSSVSASNVAESTFSTSVPRQSGLMSNRVNVNTAPSHSTLMKDPAISDGTSSQASEDVSETERLRRANSSLMEALREEKTLRTRLEKELAATKDDILEVRTQCEVDLDSSAIEIKQLKSQLRALCDNHSLTDVFASFEESVARLTRENGILRRQNLELEVKEMDLLEHGDKHVGSNDSETAVSTRSNHEKNRMLSKLRKSGQERESLKEQFEALKAKERQFLLSNKLAQDASRRLRISHQDLLRTKKELDTERLVHADTERDLRLIRQDTLELKQSESHLREERARMVHEVAMLRERVATLDDERRRNGQLSKFVTKHSIDDNQHAKQSHQMVGAGGTKRGYMGERVSVYNSSVASQSIKTRGPSSNRTHPAAYHTDDESEPLLNVPVMYERSSSDRHVLNASAVQGVAGLSNARYSRPEESHVSSADLEASLSSLHEGIIATQPSLLPTFRRLSQQIHVDRTRALEQRAKLLEMAFPTSLGSSSSSSKVKACCRAWIFNKKKILCPRSWSGRGHFVD
eukprot:gene21689-27731_t